MESSSLFLTTSRKICLVIRQKYKDSTKKKSWFTHRLCQKDWLQKWSCLHYSNSKDGFFCLACVTFPDGSYRVAKQVVTKPYHEDIANHACNDYHMNYIAQLNEFINSMKNPELLEKCPNMELFLFRIFPHSDSFSILSPNAGKYGPEKTPYLDTFHAVSDK